MLDFNAELRGWNYSWSEGRFRGSAMHVFSVTLLSMRQPLTGNTHPTVPRAKPSPYLRSNWPYNIGTEHKNTVFVPLSYFDSPSFSFGSLREKPEGVRGPDGMG
ncbi:hypothetical protein EON65_16190, partial [archaeon]